MKFIIISAVYNMSEHLKANIDMLKKQDYQNFEVYFGDDMSTDDSCEIIQENIKGDDRFHLIQHQEKLFSMGNIYKTLLIAAPNAEDIIVLIDGDDKLAHDTVFSKLKNIYTQERCLMTYGSFASEGVKDKSCKSYPKMALKWNLFRYFKWRASHLKTFKYKLWTKIRTEDLTISPTEYKSTISMALFRGQFKKWWYLRKINYGDIVTKNKDFVRRCDDKAFTLPMLEMAGERSFYVSEILYNYNAQGAHDFGSSDKKWAQRFIRQSVFNKSKYYPIEFNE